MSIVWNHIETLLPTRSEFVMLNKTNSDLNLDAVVGRLIVNHELSQAAWFYSKDGNPIKLTAAPYWAFLKEKDLTQPYTENDNQLGSTVSAFMQKLALYEKKFQLLAKATMTDGKGLYTVDYYIAGVLSRSLSLIYGFETLINSQNYLSAAHLVRTFLDNFLRLSALWLVDSPHDFAKEVWAGKRINTMKDRNGKVMTDSFLRDQAAKQYDWITNVYNETSGFIHFSNKHIVNATGISPTKKMTMQTVISKTDNGVSNESRLAAIACMIEICNCICDAVCGWIDTKRIEMVSGQRDTH